MIRLFTKLLLFVFAICLSSCQDHSSSVRLLTEAQSIIETDPAKALVLLDSISQPQDMDKEHYMQYLVANVMAKYKTYQDVKQDTTILEAVNYFENKKDSTRSAFANFYAGAVYKERGEVANTLRYFLRASTYTNVLEADPSLAMRVYDNTANLYYQEYLNDSAIHLYKKVLPIYEIENNIRAILRVSNTIGRAYEDMGQLDSAQLYFNKTLSLARETDNIKYQQFAYQNLALVYLGKKEYNQALTHYKKALTDSIAETNRVGIEIDLLNICTETKDRAEAKKYIAILAPKMQNVDGDVLYELQKSFLDYYKLIGDYKEVAKYTELTLKHEAEVEKKKHNEELLSAHKLAKAYQMEVAIQADKEQARYYIVLVLVAVLVVFGFAILAFKHSYKENKEYKLEMRRCAELNKQLIAMRKEERKM